VSKEKVVLVTDYAWPSLDPEREIFQQARVRMLVAETGSEEELVSLAPSANGILCNWKAVSAAVLRAAGQCSGVGRYGIGLDNIDVAMATRLGIVVTNVPAYCVDDVADHTMALLLACNRKVGWFDRDIKAGIYDLKAYAPLHRLRGHTLGLVGFGRIGQAVSLRAQAFGMRVIALQSRRGLASQPPVNVEFVPLGELLERSAYLSLHLPATPETNGLLDAAALQRMKDGAVLINTARGSLVRADDLVRALDAEKIAAAGIDVWQSEPLPANDPLANHPRVIATPHAAFYSDESLKELQTAAATQMAMILTGQVPQNIVNPAVLGSPNLRARLLRNSAGREAQLKGSEVSR
jgi:D-3-phosphoglycerate dehydrogenase